MTKKIALIAYGLIMSSFVFAQSSLQKRLESMVDEWGQQTGIAFVDTNGDATGINMDRPFPLLSVVKMPQALAVCDHLRSHHIPLGHIINVKKRELKPDTWSPIRDEWPKGGQMTIRYVLEQSLINSDNNACDILFRRFVSPRKVDRYLHNIGIDDCNIRYTEQNMHDDINRCYQNWMTPSAAVRLLEYVYDTKDTDEYTQFLWDTMAKCQTGKNRIPCYISQPDMLIVHKTGTGPMDQSGRLMALNDIACIVLPDGSHVALAVFVRDADKSLEECEEFIARVAQVCMDYYYNKEK